MGLNLKIINYEHITKINDFTFGFESYSDFNTLSLLSWNAYEDNSYDIVDDCMIIKIKDYLGDGYVYSVLSKKDSGKIIHQILQITDKISFVPEITVRNLRGNYNVSEDPDSNDYILNTLRFSELKGGDLKPIRKHVNSFRNRNQDVSLQTIELSDRTSGNLVYKLTEEWCKNKKFSPTELDDQMKMMDRYIEFRDNFECVDLGLFKKDRLIAFTLNQLLPDKTVMGHFGTYDNNTRYCSTFIEYITSDYFFKKGYRHINIQQDTGIPGLRQAKLSYKPEKLLKKFTITN